MQTATDLDLVLASRRGQVAAFGTLIERYQSLVCAISFSAAGDRALSEDIAQETFVSAWSSLSELKEPSKVRPWLCQIARNLTSNALRSRKREVLTDLQFDESMHTASPIDDAIEKESAQLVWDALEKIPANYREPMVLFYCQEQSSKQVAEQLDLTEATVQQRLSRGRQYLKDSIAAQVEHALTKTKPSKSIAAAVLAVIAVRTAGTASAATAATPGTTPKRITKMKIFQTIAISAIAGLTAVGGIYWRQNANSAPQTSSSSTAKASAKAAVPAHGAGFVAPTPPPSLPSNTSTFGRDPISLDPLGDNPTGRSSQVHLASGVPPKAEGFRAVAHCLYRMNKPESDPPLPTSYRVKLWFTHSASGSHLRLADLIDPIEGTTGVDDFEKCMMDHLSSLQFDRDQDDAVIKFDWDRNELRSDPINHNLKVSPAYMSGPSPEPVILYVATDYNCPSCAATIEMANQLTQQYPGKVRVITGRASVSPISQRIIAATFAADAQDKEREWAKALRPFLYAALSDAQLIDLATQAELDIPRFRADLDDPKIVAKVTTNVFAATFHITEAPTVFINDDELSGPRSIDVYKALIDRDLAAAK